MPCWPRHRTLPRALFSAGRASPGDKIPLSIALRRSLAGCVPVGPAERSVEVGRLPATVMIGLCASLWLGWGQRTELCPPAARNGPRRHRGQQRPAAPDCQQLSLADSPSSISAMRTVVEVGDWNTNAVVLRTSETPWSRSSAWLYRDGTGQPLAILSRTTTSPLSTTIRVRGRVVDICIQRLDGSTEQIKRLPSRRALGGFDDGDDGHLEQPWTGEPVTYDSNTFLVTIAS